MRRGWLWIGTVVAFLGGLVAFAAWWPRHQLDGELAAARREGLWTEWQDAGRDAARVPEAENAVPLIRRAIAADKAASTGEWDKAAIRFLKGTATPSETALLRRAQADHPEATAAWRAASERPRVDYHRRWEEGAAVLFPEYATLRRGARRLAVAARLGESPRANLLAAARLANLTRQEPVIIAALVSVSMGTITLREARHQGIAREIESALGPPIDVRRMYGDELAFALDVTRGEGHAEWYRRLGLRELPPLWYRLAHNELQGVRETTAVTHAWRDLWRDLPQDGTDYPAAATAMRRHLPGIDRRLAGWSDIYAKLSGSGAGEADRPVLALQKYAAERRAARASIMRP